MQPVKLATGNDMYAYQDVTISSIPKALGIKLYASGDAKIYINGNLLWEEEKVRIKRHYDDINLSQGIKYLHSGNNRIAVVATQATQEVNFDFALYRLD